jgi:hypothetical protein
MRPCASGEPKRFLRKISDGEDAGDDLRARTSNCKQTFMSDADIATRDFGAKDSVEHSRGAG